MKIIITMTSYPKRIQYVGKAIFRFFKTQTVKPDVFYLWLAEAEFPNKEKDLPEDLITICSAFNVKIKWTKENEYCFKRWYIYPEHYEDFVISIDDDPIYQSNLIELALKYNAIFPNTVFAIPNIGYRRVYKNSIHNDMNFHNSDKPDFQFAFCGQCIIPPKCFPMNGFTDEMNKIRKQICPICDECWFNPWFVLNGIKQYHIKEMNVKDSDFSMKDALWPKFNEGGAINKRDKQLYEVLKYFPNLMKKWKEIFPGYIID